MKMSQTGPSIRNICRPCSKSLTILKSLKKKYSFGVFKKAYGHPSRLKQTVGTKNQTFRTKCSIKLSKPNPRLCFSLLPIFAKYMLIIEKARGLIRKRKSLSLFKKKIRPSWLTTSLPPHQKPSLLVETLKKLEAIIATKDWVEQMLVFWPQMQICLTPLQLITIILVAFKTNPQKR